MNFPVIIGAAFIPMLIGFVYYHPMAFGKAWMNAVGMTEEKMKGGNRAVIFGVSIVLSILLSMQMNFVSIHQHHVANLFVSNESAENRAYFENFMALYGTMHRT